MADSSVAAVAVFPSVYVNFSEKLKVLKCKVCHFVPHWIKNTNAFGEGVEKAFGG